MHFIFFLKMWTFRFVGGVVRPLRPPLATGLLIVNVKKTKIVIFRKGGRKSVNDYWFYGDTLLEVVEQFSFLGLILSSSGKFSVTQQDIANRGLRAMFALQSHMSNFENVKEYFLLMLFDKLVTPVLTYGCEIWGFHAATAVERVHLKFLKWVLKVKRNTSNEIVYGELTRFPLKLVRLIRIITYWFKIVTDKSCLLVRNVYKLMLADLEENRNHINWASLVRTLLFNLGFGEAWFQQNVGNVNVFIRLFKQRLNDQFIQTWRMDVNAKAGCTFYRNISGNCFIDLNFDYVTVKKHREALTRFRAGNFRLPVVLLGTGRNKVPYKQRLCVTCNELGDQFHFVFKCIITEKYHYILPKFYTKKPSMYKFLQLLNSNDKNVIKKFSKFLCLTEKLL